MKFIKITKIAILIVLVIGFCISFSVIPYNNKIQNNTLSLPMLKTAQIAPIYIDDTDPDHDWDAFTSENPWCTGTGEPENPYIIYGKSIDADGGLYCVTIKNSDAFFYIDHCELYNTDPNEISARIYLENVTHGSVIFSQIYQNGYGIQALDCNLTIVYQNSIYNNNVNGIYFGGCTEGIIQENTIYNQQGSSISLFGCDDIDILLNKINGSSWHFGISLIYSNYSRIKRNDISFNDDGIYLFNSEHNSIEENTIYSNNEYGIYMEYYSSYNSLSYNILYDNQHCMLIGNSSFSTTVLSNNGVCDIYNFDDIPEPSDNNTDDHENTDDNEDIDNGEEANPQESF